MTRTDAAGRFDFAGLPPGRYEIGLTARGFEAVIGTLTLAPRDRAVVRRRLAVGAVDGGGDGRDRGVPAP